MKKMGRGGGSIEETCNYKIQERKRYNGDEVASLWKVLLPVVRIGQLLPSQEMSYIPVVQPNCGDVDIRGYTIRPPAVGVVEKGRVKKWSMNLEGGGIGGGLFDERMAGAQRDYAGLVSTKVLLDAKERRG
jgi:hypothetical protein